MNQLYDPNESWAATIARGEQRQEDRWWERPHINRKWKKIKKRGLSRRVSHLDNWDDFIVRNWPLLERIQARHSFVLYRWHLGLDPNRLPD